MMSSGCLRVPRAPRMLASAGLSGARGSSQVAWLQPSATPAMCPSALATELVLRCAGADGRPLLTSQCAEDSGVRS